MNDAKPLIVALDFSSYDEVLKLVDLLDPTQCRVKVGKELFTRCGPEVVRGLTGRGFEVFLDLKFHDIPNTVAGACRAAADLGCWMVNVHASGGRAMLEAAREAIGSGNDAPHLIAVTVLTSVDGPALNEIGVAASPEEQVLRLAALAQESELDGVVCSPLELTGLRRQVGKEFFLVTPGVRPVGAERADQRRVATPQAALGDGASYLVIGRPITAADDPGAALAMVYEACRPAVTSDGQG